MSSQLGRAPVDGRSGVRSHDELRETRNRVGIARACPTTSLNETIVQLSLHTIYCKTASHKALVRGVRGNNARDSRLRLRFLVPQAGYDR